MEKLWKSCGKAVEKLRITSYNVCYTKLLRCVCYLFALKLNAKRLKGRFFGGNKKWPPKKQTWKAQMVSPNTCCHSFCTAFLQLFHSFSTAFPHRKISEKSHFWCWKLEKKWVNNNIPTSPSTAFVSCWPCLGNHVLQIIDPHNSWIQVSANLALLVFAKMLSDVQIV